MKPFFTLFTVLILLLVCTQAKAQQQGKKQPIQSFIPTYNPTFEFKNSAGELRDTILPPFMFNVWTKSDKYPSYIHWKNLHFAILKSGKAFGLFADSVTAFSPGDTIGYFFSKTPLSTGKFNTDYTKTFIGLFMNPSLDANTQAVITPLGIMLIASKQIQNLTEITYNSQQLINMFQNDPTVKLALQRK